MEKTSGGLKYLIITLAKKKVVQIAISILIIGIPVLTVITKKVIENRQNQVNIENANHVEDGMNGSGLDDKNLAQGTISTDVKGTPSTSNESISRYSVDDGFNEIENEPPSNNSSSNTSTSVAVDNSSFTGNNVTILEGSSFNPIEDLKLNAIDRDGSNINDKIIIEGNNVNIEKPGSYQVIVSVRLNNGNKLQKTFTVYVKATNLEVSLTSFKATEEKVLKNEEIIFDVNFKSSKNYVTASAININGKEYTAYKASNNMLSFLSDTQKYKVKINSGDIAGVNEYKLSYIKMSDNTLVDLNNTCTVEVLKSEAKINDFRYETNAIDREMAINFKLQDRDKSASNLKMEIYKDNNLICTRNLENKEIYEEIVKVNNNGVYNVKVIADINLYSSSKEKNRVLNKEIFSQAIHVTTIDESFISGNDIELLQGETFEIESLNLKAIDVDGKDITNKLVVSYNDVNTSIPGNYTVTVNIINKNGKRLEKTFTIIVKKLENNIISNDNKLQIDEDLKVEEESVSKFTLINKSSEERIATNSTRGSVNGNINDTLDANVTVTGTISKGDGTAPGGRLLVEVPTALSFSIDQSGNLKSAIFTIKNRSSVGISVSVAQFNETKIGSGINVIPLKTTLDKKDRSNIHLYLQGDTRVDLGDIIVKENELAYIPESDSKVIQLLGEAGKEPSEEIDKNGVSEEFNLVFRIKKKN